MEITRYSLAEQSIGLACDFGNYLAYSAIGAPLRLSNDEALTSSFYGRFGHFV